MKTYALTCLAVCIDANSPNIASNLTSDKGPTYVTRRCTVKATDKKQLLENIEFHNKNRAAAEPLLTESDIKVIEG